MTIRHRSGQPAATDRIARTSGWRAVTATLIRFEAWLPALCGAVWWVVFYPGFFGEDSLINLNEVRSGTITVWFTAWWIYVVDFLTLGTRAIPLLTLVTVLTLQYALYLWAVTCFPAGAVRTFAVLSIAASPLVGAIGVQLRHDASMTAGLLLCTVAITRTWPPILRWGPQPFLLLVIAAPLVATRHNGVPTLLGAAGLCVLLFGWAQWRQAAALAAVAAAAMAITVGATRASGNVDSIDPVQTVEWLMADISCLLTKDGIEASPDESAVLGRIASTEDWPHQRACVFMNPIFVAPTFRPDAIRSNYGPLLRVWLSLGARYPAEMVAVHLVRVRAFVPPLITGLPSNELMPFIHSTILPNDFGLEWAFPTLATWVRPVVRAWNALRFLLANVALWLMVLCIAAWKWPVRRRALVPAIVIGLSLELGLLVTAPISEGRYGLFILACGQLTGLFLVLEAVGASRRSSTCRPM